MDEETALENCARWWIKIWKGEKFHPFYEKEILSGGGGASMAVNGWAIPSFFFNKRRISLKLEKELAAKGYSFRDLEKNRDGISVNNAKGAKNRRAKGKIAHADHCPGNVKILAEIKDFVLGWEGKEEDLQKALEKWMRSAQTIDWITVEEDDLRTLKCSEWSKKEKDMMSREQKDLLIGGSAMLREVS